MTLWRAAVGYAGVYKVSDQGDVRRVGGRVLRASMPSAGSDYRRVNLSMGGRQKMHTVHALVAEAFLDPRPTLRHEVNHKNGIKIDNRANNLEWATRAENIQHAYDTGLASAVTSRGESSPRAKLTDDAVREIRRLHGVITQRELAERFGISSSIVSGVQSRKRWGHVQ